MSYQEKYLKYKNKYLALKASLEQNNNYENNIIEKIENELNISNLNSIPQYAGGLFDDDSDSDLIDLGRLSQSEIQFGGDSLVIKPDVTDTDLGLPEKLPALSDTEVEPEKTQPTTTTTTTQAQPTTTQAQPTTTQAQPTTTQAQPPNKGLVADGGKLVKDVVNDGGKIVKDVVDDGGKLVKDVFHGNLTGALQDTGKLVIDGVEDTGKLVVDGVEDTVKGTEHVVEDGVHLLEDAGKAILSIFGGDMGDHGLPSELPPLDDDSDMIGGNLDDSDSLSDSDSSLKISDSESSDSENN